MSAATTTEDEVQTKTLQQIDREAGVMALAYMPDAEFQSRLKAMETGLKRARTIQHSLMTQDEDYGVIPGTKKPTLLKPGAEKLCNVYRLVPSFHQDVIQGDGVLTPDIRILTKCKLHLGDTDGPVVGEGVGACNSFERRYRYRRGERPCPVCGAEGFLLKSKRNAGEWFCWSNPSKGKNGCGKVFPAGSEEAESIESMPTKDVVNQDPYDQENTIAKISVKRAYIDATLRATATSGLFTQDVEDMQRHQQSALQEEKIAKAGVGMAEIDELHQMIQERTKNKSWLKALDYCNIKVPQSWKEPENADQARLNMLWMSKDQAATLKRTLLGFRPVEKPKQVVETTEDDGDPALEREPGVEVESAE